MKFRRVLLAISVGLLLTACQSSSDSTDYLGSGRNNIEASRCVGIDRYAEAISDLEKVVENDAGLSEAYYWLYIAYTETGDSAQATAALSSLEELATFEETPKTWFWLLRTYSEDRDSAGQESTLATLEAAAEANPEDADTLYWLGRARYVAGDADGAFEAFQAAAELDADNAPVHFWLGQLYSERGNLELAWQEFEAVIEIDPENAAAYHNRGTLAYQIGTIGQALSDLQAAQTRDPDDPQTHYQLGAIYLMQAIPASSMGQPDMQSLQSAETEFETALELCPGMPEPLIGMGNLLLIQGDPVAALESLNEALEYAPTSAEAWFAVAQTNYYLGDNEAACDAFTQFLALSPPEMWAEQAIDVMTELGCE
jgi:tetratricopeptide (TPR) repeat protein